MLIQYLFLLSVIGTKVNASSGHFGEPDTNWKISRSRDGGIDSMTEHQYLGNSSRPACPLTLMKMITCFQIVFLPEQAMTEESDPSTGQRP